MKINLNDRRCRPDGEWAPNEITYVHREELTSVDLDTLRPGDHLVYHGDLTPQDIELLKFVVADRPKHALPSVEQPATSDCGTWDSSVREPRRKLKRNAIECSKCGDVIESASVHDFKWCKCKAIFVDGGLDYCRQGGDLGAIIDRSEYEEEAA